MKLSEYFDKSTGDDLLARALEFSFRLSVNLRDDPDVEIIDPFVPVVYIPEYIPSVRHVTATINKISLETKRHRFAYSNDAGNVYITITHAHYAPHNLIFIGTTVDK